MQVQLQQIQRKAQERRGKTDICFICFNFKAFIYFFIFLYFPILLKVMKLKFEAF